MFRRANSPAVIIMRQYRRGDCPSLISRISWAGILPRPQVNPTAWGGGGWLPFLPGRTERLDWLLLSPRMFRLAEQWTHPAHFMRLWPELARHGARNAARPHYGRGPRSGPAYLSNVTDCIYENRTVQYVRGQHLSLHRCLGTVKRGVVPVTYRFFFGFFQIVDSGLLSLVAGLADWLNGM